MDAAKLYVGVISGTSVDGLDLALLEIDHEIRFLRSETVALATPLRDQLLALGQPGADEIDRLGAADRQLGRAIGVAVNEFLAAAGIRSETVTAIGSHGQTIRHRPDGAAPFTMQIGDPNQITETTGITCVADFRRRDMAAGGQGAPLVPPFHAALFRVTHEHRVILNIGGISNITVLSSDPEAAVVGFDTGPGNGLMDAWIAQCKQLPYDVDGSWAGQGKRDDGLLNNLLADPYLAKSPPKSTGREHFNLAWLTECSRGRSVAEVDVQATLLEFTAVSICEAARRSAPHCQRLLACGGGRNNTTLMSRLANLAQYPVENIDEYGVDGDGLEAGAFAWLAHQNLEGLPGNEPNVSGASGNRILGAVYHR
ncbi:MAG: anhydro-N-acetylmuramic acid kinase [Gammaproteobacteria bacterium]|nr:anhydro-N-acetylmuramic acid kinase [Gammaproteobacteria bacterium]